ncbi:MAG TPA: SDR family NAD(P)-dependent oxidoreductase, partial [Halobacteriales archaeon]|nr:SDR family NAD(P)-dependent oxidoreductase [Halobacteriales archaeon]
SIAADVESEHGVETLVAPTDVSEEASVEAMVTDAVAAFGDLDVVVANAGTGTGPGIPVEDLPTDQYRTVTDVNVDGMFYTARAALPHLRASAGTLVFVASFAGKYPRPGSPVYAATKWWTRGFALSLAGQVGPDDVGVTVVNPSEVRTEFGKEYREDDELAKERFDPADVTNPEDVAEAIAFAARAEPPNAVTELDLYRRDKFEGW